MPVAAAAAAPGVLVIGKRVKRVIVEWVPPRLRVLLQVGVLMGGGSVVARAGIVRV